MSEGQFTAPHNLPIDLPMNRIAEFCTRWGIVEFALFGSVLRDDFGPESDIDVLVQFTAERKYKLRDILQMEREIEALLGREVDLVDRLTVERSENYLRRRAILNQAQVIYHAARSA